MADINNTKTPQQQPNDPNIYVYDVKTGQRVNNVTADNFHQYYGNGNYRIDGDSQLPITNPDGKGYTVVTANEYDPTRMKIAGSSYVPPEVKYGSMSSMAQNAGRQVANALTLGGYGAVADRFSTEQERNEAKMREEYNPISTAVAQTVPYLIPVAGEALGAANITSKVGKAAYEAATFVPTLGTRTAGVLGQELNSTLGLITQGIVDGAAQGFTAGVNSASLDNDLSSESLANIILSTSIGSAMGGVAGGAIGGSTAIARRLANGIGGGRSLPELNLANERPSPEILKGWRYSKENEDLMKSFAKDPQAQSVEYAINTRKATAESIGRMVDDIQSVLVPNQPLEKAAQDKLDFLTALGSSNDIMNKVLSSGEIGINNFASDAIKYKNLASDSGGFASFGRPMDRLKKDLKVNLESINSSVKSFNQASVAIERNKISEQLGASNLSNATLPDLVSTVKTGENSIHNKIMDTLNSYSTEEGILNRIKSINPGASESTIQDLLASESSRYDKNLINRFRGSMAESAASLEGGITKGTVSHLNVHEYLENSIAGIDKAWFDYKNSLPLGSKPSPDNASLMQSIKQPLLEMSTNKDIFGSAAADRIISRQLRREMIEAERELKAAIGQKADKPINYEKLVNDISSTDQYKSQNAQAALAQYRESLDRFGTGIKSMFPEIDDRAIRSLSDSAGQVIERADDIRILQSKHLKDFWEEAEAAAAAKLETSHGLRPSTRILFAVRDLLHMQPMYAARQALSAAADVGLNSLKDLAKWVRESYTPSEQLARRVQSLSRLAENNKSLTEKISQVAESITTSGGTTRLARSIPYTTASQFGATQELKDEIERKYEQAKDFVNSVIYNAKDHIIDIDNKTQGLKELAPQLHSQTLNSVANKVGVLSKSFPPSSSSTYGRSNQTIAEKAYFVDMVNVVLDPKLAMDLIQDGTITPAQMNAFQLMNPVLYARLKNEIVSKIQVSKTPISYSSKAYSLFGIQTSPIVSNQNMMKMFSQSQQSMPNSMASPSTKLPSGFRPAGVDRAHFGEHYTRKNTP